MNVFGTAVISAMALHVALFAASGFLTVALVRKFFPATAGCLLVPLLFFAFTFDDRPESLAYIFGVTALWLVARQIVEGRFRLGLAVALLFVLWLGLYTSVIVGACFFGAGFLACVTAAWKRWQPALFVPFVGAAALFALVTLAIIRFEPLWWAGFMESARQQPVMNGFHLPRLEEALKVVRTAPVFLLALALLPWALRRRHEFFAAPSAWLCLTVGILAMGGVLLAFSITLLTANYVNYLIFLQVILAAGMLALVRLHFPARQTCLSAALIACIVLVSLRALGMTTWGIACAAKNSYRDTQAVLRQELAPFTRSDQPVLLSSAFLYAAVDLGVKNPVHSDWYFDHSHWTNGVQAAGLFQCRPPKLILTQFDYYRAFKSPLDQLRGHPDAVEVRVRNLAAVPPPEAVAVLQRVIQHVSWAPVIIDLDWKTPLPKPK